MSTTSCVFGTPSFSPGRIILDHRSSKKLTSEDVIPALSRHVLGDWGKVSERCRKGNQIALWNSQPIRSIYFSSDGVTFSVVTSGDRSITTVKVL